jgi:hypothetical protein
VPRVVFVNEHRVVDAELGKSVRDVAREAGVALGRAGLVWVEEGAPGAAGPRAWMERVRGLRGWRRLASRARVLGDLKVYSSPAGASRVGRARVIAGVPSPVIDPTAPRKPDDAASTAAHVHGHPSAVGRGLAPVATEIPAPPPSRANAARPISTVPPPPNDEREDGVL